MLIVTMISQIPELRIIPYFLPEKEVENESERLSISERSGILWQLPSLTCYSYVIETQSLDSHLYRRQINDEEGASNILKNSKA